MKTILFFCLILFLSVAVFAQAPQPLPLKPVFANNKALPIPVQVQWTLKESILVIDFTVKSSVLNQKQSYGPKDFPFQHDVVEVFLGVDNSTSYYELEVTPLNQTYEVHIIDLHQPFVGGIHTGAVTLASVQKNQWTAHLEIPLTTLQWTGDIKDLRGNFYAILGNGNERTYYSTFLPAQKKPNFHQPQFFKNLF